MILFMVISGRYSALVGNFGKVVFHFDQEFPRFRDKKNLYLLSYAAPTEYEKFGLVRFR